MRNTFIRLTAICAVLLLAMPVSAQVLGGSPLSTLVATTTWASRPAAANYANRLILVTDVGPYPSEWVSDGTYWKPVGSVVLCRGNTQLTTTSSSEVTMASCTVPASAMGTNGRLEISAYYTETASANTKTPRIRHSASNSGSSGTSLAAANSGGTTVSTFLGTSEVNRASQSSQIAPASNQVLGLSASAPIPGSIDTSVDSYINFNGQVAAGETLALETYVVTLRP